VFGLEGRFGVALVNIITYFKVVVHWEEIESTK
jgi:hypothetical protein